MKKILFLLSLLLALSLSPETVFAAKKRVWKQSVKPAVVTIAMPSYSVKIRSDRRALNITFNNLNTVDFTVSGVEYELTYLGNDIEQGVVGSIKADEGNSTTRQLLFGTCSKNVCTYHRNIKDARLKITCKLKNGKTLIKKYLIKI